MLTLTFATVAVLFVLAVAGWARTHSDLICRPDFCGQAWLRTLCTVVPPLAALGLTQLVHMVFEQSLQVTAFLIALGFGSIGGLLLILRPFKDRGCYVREDPGGGG